MALLDYRPAPDWCRWRQSRPRRARARRSARSTWRRRTRRPLGRRSAPAASRPGVLVHDVLVGVPRVVAGAEPGGTPIVSESHELVLVGRIHWDALLLVRCKSDDRPESPGPVGLLDPHSGVLLPRLEHCTSLRMWTADSRPPAEPFGATRPTPVPRLSEAANRQVITQDGPGPARRVIPQPPRPYPTGLSSAVGCGTCCHCTVRHVAAPDRETAEPAHHIQDPAAVAELAADRGGTMRQLIVPVRP